MFGFIKGLIPGTARYSRKHHVKYLRKKARGHDALLLVEWEDGKLTELGADVHPEMDGWYEATNGLVFAPAGEGADPVDYYGVPTIRCHSQIACPFSTEACLAADFDEAGQFQYNIDREDGTTQQVVEVDMADQPQADQPGAGNGANGQATADGGEEMVRSYDLRPPAGAVGYSFSLTQAKQRAPNAISANMIRRAVEYGKEKARNEGLYMKGLLHGGGMILGTLIIIALLYIIGGAVLGGGGGGGGSGGGGGGFVFGSLLLLAGPRLGRARDELKADLEQMREQIRRHPRQFALASLRGILLGLSAATAMIGYCLMLLTSAVFWGEWFGTHPTVASEPLWVAGQSVPLATVVGLLHWIAAAAPVLLLLYWYTDRLAGAVRTLREARYAQQ
ncbi:hypothetical protein [Haloplanus halophilus]|uniref:hypothetical protein n=1 Tax=Haloplanus halophilus TaxID=2949993 RepID=UPI00203E724F|nr:hypothetical protein [Haloplanus sp. GDY1]